MDIQKQTHARITTGFRVSDALWAVLEPLLPMHVNTHRYGGGRPRVSDRDCADAIFYVLCNGGHWAALKHTDLCAKSTAHDRFQKWLDANVFSAFWHAGAERFDELHEIDWRWLRIECTVTKARLNGEQTMSNPIDTMPPLAS